MFKFQPNAELEQSVMQETKATVAPPPAAPSEPLAKTESIYEGNIYSPPTNGDDVYLSEGQPENGTNLLVIYAISLGLLASILTSIVSLLEVCFNYLGTADSGDDWLSGYTLKFLLWTIANLLIAVPLFILILLKSRKYEPQALTSTVRKVRNFLYGTFMTLLGLAAISSLANVVYSFMIPLAPKDDFDVGSAAWVGIAQAILTTAVLVVTFFYKLKAQK